MFVGEEAVTAAALPAEVEEALAKSGIDTGSIASGPIGPAGMPFSPTGSVIAGPTLDKKKEEEAKAKAKSGSPFNVLARNIKFIEKVTLYLAFVINVILLFHRINIIEPENPNGELEGDDDDEMEPIEEIFITGLSLPWLEWELSGFWLGACLYWLSVVHASFSFLLLIAFIQLKVPLMTFKREKEVSRRLLFQGTWLVEDEEEERSIPETFFWHVDRLVISSPNFPRKYWDKFVRKKAKNKFSDQVKEATLNRLLTLQKNQPAPSPDQLDMRFD